MCGKYIKTWETGVE